MLRISSSNGRSNFSLLACCSLTRPYDTGAASSVHSWCFLPCSPCAPLRFPCFLCDLSCSLSVLTRALLMLSVQRRCSFSPTKETITDLGRFRGSSEGVYVGRESTRGSKGASRERGGSLKNREAYSFGADGNNKDVMVTSFSFDGKMENHCRLRPYHISSFSFISGCALSNREQSIYNPSPSIVGEARFHT